MVPLDSILMDLVSSPKETTIKVPEGLSGGSTGKEKKGHRTVNSLLVITCHNVRVKYKDKSQ